MKKELKIFTFFVEPSVYTLDLIKNVHKQLSIDYIFLNDKVIIAKSNEQTPVRTMNRLSLIEKVLFLIKVSATYRLIVFNGYNHWEFVFLFFLNMLKGQKLYLAIESDTQAKEDSGWRKKAKRIFLKMFFYNSKVLGFSGGNFIHKQLFRQYGMNEERIFLMPMMVNNKKFEFKDRKKKDSPFTFLYVGRIIPHKNVELLIKIFLNTFSSSEDVKLKIVGTGKSLEELRKKYSKSPNISFEGAKFGQDLVDSYHTSNVLVIPSLYEPWGLVVNEALSAGLPVLASNRVGAIYDLIENRDTGFIFDPDKSEELKVLMRKIFEDGDLYKRQSSNAAKLMKEYWNYELYRKNLEDAVKYVERQISGVKK